MQRSKANIPQHSGDLYSDPPSASVASAAREGRSRHQARDPKSRFLPDEDVWAPNPKLFSSPNCSARRSSNRFSGKAVVPDDHPLTTGGIGLLGTAPSQEVLEECDTLIIAGSSFPYLEFYPKPGQARAVQIDLDAGRIGLRYPVEVGLVGHCWDVLRALLPLIAEKADRSFLEAAQQTDEAVERTDGGTRHPMDAR